MRGVITIFMILILILLFVALSLGMISIAQQSHKENTTSLEDLFKPKRVYDIGLDNILINQNKYLTNQNFENFLSEDGEFCQKLKACIKDSVRNDGRECMIAEDEEFTTIAIYAYLNFTHCSQEDLNETVGRVSTKICNFAGMERNNIKIMNEYENVVKGIQNPFYPYEPYIHGCDFGAVAGDYSYPNNGKRNFFVFDLLFREHPVVGKGYPHDATGGKVTLILSNASPGSDAERTCNFNVFACIQPAIASSENEKVTEIYNIIQTFTEKDLRCCEDSVYSSSANLYKLQKDKLFPRQIKIEFSAGDVRPNIYQILVGIDRGLWDWSKINFENKNMINSILKDAEINYNFFNQNIKIFPTADRVRFSSKPWKFAMIDSSLYPINVDNCYADNIEDITSGSTWSPSNTPDNGPLLIPDDVWWYGLGDKFLDTDYNKLAITFLFFYDFQRIDGIDNVIITPRVLVCRDR